MTPYAENLALLIWAATPDRPDLFMAPLIYALSARALDTRVEMHFAGPAVRWLEQGYADTQYPMPGAEQSIGEVLAQVLDSGVELMACSMARTAWLPADAVLIPHKMAGATAFVSRSLQGDWRTLVF